MVARGREGADVERRRHREALLPVFKPLEDILGNLRFVLAAQHDVHAGDFGNLLTLELGITSRDHHQGVRILADEVADVLTALAVGKRGHATRVHYTHIRHFSPGNGLNTLLGEQ